MLLALRLGRHDWRALLDELTPQEFIEWWALLLLEGMGPDGLWHRTGTIAAMAHNAGVRVAAALGVDNAAGDLHQPADYIPGGPDRVIEARTMTAAESEERARRLYG